jgi:nitrogen regulatory protein PII
MSREGLTRMTKVEVVVGGEDADAVREVFARAEVRGYTALSGVSGLGHDGYHQGRLLFNDQATLELLISVVPEEKLDVLVAGLRTLFADASGVFFVSDAWVGRPEHFA